MLQDEAHDAANEISSEKMAAAPVGSMKKLATEIIFNVWTVAFLLRERYFMYIRQIAREVIREYHAGHELENSR